MKTKRLHVFYDNNSVFSDITDSMVDYGRDTEAIVIIAAEDKLYTGYRKPINAEYIEMATANTNVNTMTVKYYNGTAFAAVVGYYDRTKGLTRSGFVSWDRNQTTEAVTTIDGQEAYWYEHTFSADHSAGTILGGLNIVFSDDEDLKEEHFQILDYLDTAGGENSYILKHVAARNEIIQKLRNDGRFKHNISNGNLSDLDAFDLLNFEQVREASKYLVLSKLFFNRSDAPDDAY